MASYQGLVNQNFVQKLKITFTNVAWKLKTFQTFLSEENITVSRTEQKQNKISFLVFMMIKIRKKAKFLLKVPKFKKDYL